MTNAADWWKYMSDETRELNAELFGAKSEPAQTSTTPKQAGSDLEVQFAQILDLSAFAGKYEREYRFHPNRLWRFDFALTESMIAFEVEGGVWSQGRHTRGYGFIEDCDKYNEAALYGWQVYRFTSEHIKDGRAWDVVNRLATREGQND